MALTFKERVRLVDLSKNNIRTAEEETEKAALLKKEKEPVDSTTVGEER